METESENMLESISCAVYRRSQKNMRFEGVISILNVITIFPSQEIHLEGDHHFNFYLMSTAATWERFYRIAWERG